MIIIIKIIIIPLGNKQEGSEMNFIRKLVSGKRRRYQDMNFDLDITYITSRVIAMSFPASGMVESSYRNPISKVRNRYWDYYRF